MTAPTISERLKSGLQTFNWKWFISRCLVIVAAFLIVSTLLLGWLFCPLNRSMFNFVLFHPFADGNYRTTEVAGCKVNDVYFPATDGNKLHAWYLKKPNSQYTILLSHGNGGNLTWRLDLIGMLLKSGASVFAYDYEGYGRSEGKPSVEICCDDALCAYQYLVNHEKMAPSKIILCGESLGTGITGNLSSKVPSAGIILQCPLYSLQQRATEILPATKIFPRAFYPANALDNGAVFSQKHPPLLIIGGVEDIMLPIVHADSLFATAIEPKTYIRIEGAGHTGDPLLVQSKKYAEGLKTFMASLATHTDKTEATAERGLSGQNRVRTSEMVI